MQILPYFQNNMEIDPDYLDIGIKENVAQEISKVNCQELVQLLPLFKHDKNFKTFLVSKMIEKLHAGQSSTLIDFHLLVEQTFDMPEFRS